MASENSKRLRSRGNQLYKEACADRLAPVVRSGRFLKASSFYRQALDASRSEDERAKCSKNLGAVHWRHAKMSLDLYDDGQASSLLHERPPSFDVEKSIEHYLAALRHGRASRQHQEWIEDIEKNLEEIVKSLLEEHDWLAEKVFLEKICALFQSSPNTSLKARALEILHLGFSQIMLNQATKELNRKDQNSSGANYSKCLALLHSCNGPLEEAVRNATPESREKVMNLKASVDSCRSKCESAQAREAGKRFLQESQKARDEASRHDLVYSALDKFKEASVLARGVDTESEAEALVCIADLYKEVLRKDQHAQPYYSKVLTLANSSATMQKATWYEKAKVALNTIFKRRAESTRPTSNVLPEIRVDLDKIEKEFKRANTEDFLRYLYKSYPPKTNDARFNLGELENGTQTRSALKVALRHYHPDHNATGEDKWTALCGEITKMLLEKHRSYAPQG